jgi:hypothetical protein
MANLSPTQQIETLQKHFNNYAETLFIFMESILQNNTLKLIKPFISQLVKENSNKIIDNFILTVFQYEEKILAGDDDFFLKQDFSELNLDNQQVMQVFEFKSIWTSLIPDNQKTIKEYMQLLCKIARKYFNIKYDNKN